MSWKKNKLLLSVITLCICSLIGVGSGLSYFKGEAYTVEVWEVGTKGYGYKILRNEQAVIVQPFVPAVSGRKYFNHPDDARRVGELVCKRLNSGESFTVTAEDFKRLEITSFAE